jgi:hypothetical protein
MANKRPDRRPSRSTRRERPVDPNQSYSVSHSGNEGPSWMSENSGKVLVGVAFVILILGVIVLSSGAG